MVYQLKTDLRPAMQPIPPERRRAVIIGAAAAGISAAYHLGEHCLLLDQRDELEGSHDRSNDFPMGTARGGALGAQRDG